MTVLDVVPDPQGRGDLGVQSQAKHAIANYSQTVSPMLPLGKYKRAAIPPFVKLLWSLIIINTGIISIRRSWCLNVRSTSVRRVFKERCTLHIAVLHFAFTSGA